MFPFWLLWKPALREVSEAYHEAAQESPLVRLLNAKGKPRVSQLPPGALVCTHCDNHGLPCAHQPGTGEG